MGRFCKEMLKVSQNRVFLLVFLIFVIKFALILLFGIMSILFKVTNFFCIMYVKKFELPNDTVLSLYTDSGQLVDQIFYRDYFYLAPKTMKFV